MASLLNMSSRALVEKTLDFNGHEYVDLGLPSGLLWAKCNVGATIETEAGRRYKYGLGADSYNKSQEDYTGIEDPLSLDKDTARQVMGGDWRMPTRAELNELIAYTTYTAESINGVSGGKYTALNGNYIFIPKAGFSRDGYSFGGTGYIWSSTPLGNNNAYAMRIYGSTDIFSTGYKDGLNVRGVISN